MGGSGLKSHLLKNKNFPTSLQASRKKGKGKRWGSGARARRQLIQRFTTVPELRSESLKMMKFLKNKSRPNFRVADLLSGSPGAWCFFLPFIFCLLRLCLSSFLLLLFAVCGMFVSLCDLFSIAIALFA